LFAFVEGATTGYYAKGQKGQYLARDIIWQPFDSQGMLFVNLT